MNSQSLGAQPVQMTPKKKPRWGCWISVAIVLILLAIVIGYFIFLVQQNIKDLDNDSVNQSAVVTPETTDDPFKGDENAKVVIVEFSDFECPFCLQAFPIVREVMSTYGDQIKFIYRDFPDTVSHPNAQKAAEAGECAHEQGKFWEMHDKMFININYSGLSVPALKQYAQEIRLDTESFNKCLDEGRYEYEVLQDIADGYLLGVDATPTFFIDGHRIAGVIPLEEFKEAIDLGLER